MDSNHETGSPRHPQSSHSTETVPLLHPAKTAPVTGPAPVAMFPSVVAAFVTATGFLCMGYTLGYSSPATHDLQAVNGSVVTHGANIKLDSSALAWFGSLVSGGAMVGGFVAGLVAEFAGRKLGMMMCSLPFCGGWSLLAFGDTVAALYAGRFLTGMAAGMVTSIGPIYIAEVVPPEVRGRLSTVSQIMMMVGILTVYALSTVVPSYKWLAIIGIGLSAFHVTGVVFLPETPRWYLARGRRSDAKASLVWLRGAGALQAVEDECASIEAALESRPRESIAYREFTKPALRRPLLISLALMFFRQWSGITAVVFYAGIIMKSAGFHNANQASIILAGLQVVFTAIGSALTDKAGRRVLLAASGIGMCVASVAMGVYYKEVIGVVFADVSWKLQIMAVVALGVYVSAFSVGLGAIPWLVMAEIFPNRARSAASGMVTFFNWGMSFIVTLTFFHMREAFGLDVVFWLYGGVCLALVLFVIFCLPETKGRTLEENERLFATPSSINSLHSSERVVLVGDSGY